VSLDLFAVVAPGLEDICAAELAALGLAPTALPGGVAFSGDVHALAAANLHLATATRVLVRLGEFQAPGFPELPRRASTSRSPPTSRASTTPAASASESLRA
jgi:putative N6-adenine-specific DNA methylase